VITFLNFVRDNNLSLTVCHWVQFFFNRLGWHNIVKHASADWIALQILKLCFGKCISGNFF
jgi:hypothetical protein